jgi:hypothetical protein
MMKPSILFVLRSAWNDTLASLHQLRNLALVVFLIYFAEQLARTFLLPERLGETLDGLVGAVSAFAIVPYQIAIYRLIVLGEVTANYSFAANTNRIRRFLAWSAGLWVATIAPTLIFGLLPIGLGAALTVAVVIVGIIILFRLILLFPAIAVDATGASATNAFADSNGHLWFIARSVLVAFIPMAFALVVIIALAFSNACNIPNPDTDRTLIGTAILGALETITTTSSGVVVARLYEWIGERVKGMGDSNPDPRYHPLA